MRYYSLCYLLTMYFLNEMREVVNKKFDRSSDTSEAKVFKLSISKTEYLTCKCSKRGGGIEDEVTIKGVAIPRVEHFCYMASIIREGGDIDEDINHRIKIE